MSEGPGTGSPLPPEGENQELPKRLEALQASFAKIDPIVEPLVREVSKLDEAARLKLTARAYAGLFETFQRKSVPRWLLEPQMGRFVEWSARLSILKFLASLGRLAAVVAIGSFLVECPDRTRQAHYAKLGIIESTRGVVVSGARIDAFEELNRDCFSLAGIRAPGARLVGLRMDRCYGFPGGAWLSRLLPMEPRGARLYHAELSGADLRSARLANANLASSLLEGAWLDRADLRVAHLAGAMLRGAHLIGANLYRADLQDAHLEGADLSGADLSQANLTGAFLQSARLIGARLDGATIAYGHLNEVVANRAVLTGADLFKADLGGARLRKVRFDSRTSFDSAVLAKAIISNPIGLQVDTIKAAKDFEHATMDDFWGMPVAEHPDFRVGVLTLDRQYFFAEIESGVSAAVEELNQAPDALRHVAKPLVVRVAAEPGMEAFREKEKVDALIEQGVDGILIDAEDEHNSVAEARDAYEAGLVVVCYDHCIDREHMQYVAGSFQSDQFQLGRETGEAVARWIGQQSSRTSVGILRYCETDGCYVRVKGFRAALDETRVNWAQAAAYHRDKHKSGVDLAEEMLTQHPEITVAWSANEEGTESLVIAVRELGLQDKVKVWGTDISPRIAAMLLASDGVLQGVTAQDPREMGRRAMVRLIEALRQDRYAAPPRVETAIKVYDRNDREAISAYLKETGSLPP